MSAFGPRVSRCTQGGRLDFHWYGDPQSPNATAIDAAAYAFALVMRPPGRLWNPYTWAAAKGDFKARLRLAEHGALTPVDHVKDIVRGDPESLFEIRWDIDVVDRRDDGVQVMSTTDVRLYHSEPSKFPTRFVGLHVHEKEIVDGDPKATNDLQDAEIDKAVDKYDKGEASDWGI